MATEFAEFRYEIDGDVFVPVVFPPALNVKRGDQVVWKNRFTRPVVVVFDPKTDAQRFGSPVVLMEIDPGKCGDITIGPNATRGSYRTYIIDSRVTRSAEDPTDLPDPGCGGFGASGFPAVAGDPVIQSDPEIIIN